ncbi:MAG TPA: tRNA lysidine(34) synthetase TilS, partial [Verrucomicrobiae bacterium]|nr:tRNA lysidine(34) synthetase TilS [Verrucomicrobiae bacterium]
TEVRYREDTSNAEAKFQRNRLRHEVLPELLKFQPQLGPITLRAAEMLLAEKEYLGEEAEEWLRTGGKPFHLLHRALQREIIRLQILKLERKPNFELIEYLRLKCGKSRTLSPGFQVSRDESGRLTPQQEKCEESGKDELQIEIGEEGQISWGGLNISWMKAAQREGPSAGVEFFDRARLGSTILLRFWRPGDRFQVIGMEHVQKLQDLFTNAKLPAEERHRRVVAVSEGRIFWVEGLRIGEQVKVGPETRQILEWRWRRLAEPSA